MICTGFVLHSHNVLSISHVFDMQVHQARNPVRFHEATQIVKQSSLSMVFDIGPQRVISTLLRPIGASVSLVSGHGKRGSDQDIAMLLALCRVFEHGVSFNFESFYEGRNQPRPSLCSIPTYPWQRKRHYPTFTQSRNSSKGSLPQPAEETPRFGRGLIFDDKLFELLGDHTHGGVRIVPSSVFISFALLNKSNRSRLPLERIQFHSPLVLEQADTSIDLMMAADQSFTLSHSTASDTRVPISSGTFVQTKPRAEHRPTTISTSLPPHILLTRKEIYVSGGAGSMAFGPLFQNVHQLSIWKDHADGVIKVPRKTDQSHTLFLQLDACLHMCAALSRKLADKPPGAGTFLPHSLEGVYLYTDSLPLPDTFICRYPLPFNRDQGPYTMSTSFEVLSESGQLLMEAKAYNVAWIPAGLIRHGNATKAIPLSPIPVLWKAEESAPRLSKVRRSGNDVIYFGSNADLVKFLETGLENLKSMALEDLATSASEQPQGGHCP